MAKLFNFLKKCRLLFLIVLLFIFCQNNAVAQKPKKTIWDKVNDTKQGLATAVEIANSVARLADATKRTAAEFNKKVTVVKSSDPKPVVPPNQINQPKYIKGKFTNLSWEPVANFDNQLFPSMIISMAVYKGPILSQFMSSVKSSALGFRLLSNQSYLPLKWEIECIDKSFFDKASGEVIFQKAGGEMYFMPDIPWNYEALDKHLTSTPINVYFRLFDDQGNKVEQLKTLTLRSVNDCIFKYKEESLNFLFTAFVQEEHPGIEQILKEALNTKMIPSIVGYQWGDKYVDLQVAAIWKVLHDRGFQYSSITDNSGVNDNEIYSQNVRTFDNAIKTRQANCVDGTVVFASILKRIGIRPILVTVPGHCFLGYYSNGQDTSVKSIRFLETTMLSFNNYMSRDSVTKYKKLFIDNYPKNYQTTASEMDKEYFLQFISARSAGEGDWKEYNSKYGQFPNTISRLDVNNLRRYVKPLPIYE